MRLRHVVTCFLENPADGSVLLGCRSEKVATYPGHWAAISGSVEDIPPLEQAYCEIEEETGLDRSCVDLARAGRPVRFPDWALGTLWVVHPFLFTCNGPERVRCDWEHLEFRWLAPDDMAGLQTVPRLRDAWRSASTGAGGDSAEALFQAIRDDREHGAEELGLWTLEALESASRAGADVTAACRRALGLRPSMAPIRSALLRVFESARAAPNELPERIAGLIVRRERDGIAPAAAAGDYIPDGTRVATLSSSFTVLCALRDWSERIAHLTVAESRPACEGRETARLAASFGIETELVTDAAAFATVGEVDLVLLGADSVIEDGSVVNKTGSLALACAAGRFGADVIALTTQSKILPAGFFCEMELMPGEELGEPIEGVQAANPYFESVPSDLIRFVVMESGAMSVEGLNQVARELRLLQDALMAGGSGI